LHLTIRSLLFYGNDQGAMELFSCLGDLSLFELKLNMFITGQVLDLSKIEKFLAGIDYLQIQQDLSWAETSFDSKKSLNLATIPFKEFYPHELVAKCSSLKGLRLEGNDSGKSIPQDLGRAKNIIDLSIDIEVKSDEMVSSHLSRLYETLSQANSLEIFSLSFSGLEGNSLGQLDHLHKLLSHIKIKHYKLKLGPVLNDCDDTQLEGLLNQLTVIQTLKSLNLDIKRINDAHPFKVLLKSFPKLLSLNIKIGTLKESELSFPFEDLIHLSSLETLMILIPLQNKNEILNRLPHLERLKDLTIGSDDTFIWNLMNTITIKDYSRAKSASLFAKPF